MTKSQFKVLTWKLVDEYGVNSYLDNEDDIEENNIWFNCPSCGEPILYDDWASNEELENWICPICALELFE